MQINGYRIKCHDGGGKSIGQIQGCSLSNPGYGKNGQKIGRKIIETMNRARVRSMPTRV